jgi:MinD superfamily P-loop ATPase
MSYKIAVASGKGGTGKTTVSVNLFHFFTEYKSKKVKLVDCDVEEPNDAIFFSNIEVQSQKNINQLIPQIDNSKCTYCKKCVEYCEFNSIVVIPKAKFAEINGSLCHSCGACLVACKFDAIKEFPQPIGTVTYRDTDNNNQLIEGRLKIGSTMQTMVIKETKKSIDTADADIIIYDAPPGTSCPVVETISDVDYIILVTEPTPFGLHDLKLMVDLLKDIKIPYGVIINKAGLGNNKVYEYLKKENIDIIGEIPFDKDYASKYAAGNLTESISNKFADNYKKIIDTII